MFHSQVAHSLVRLRELFPPTPLQFSKFLSDRYNADIYLKREDQSPVRSYKIRGAFNYISQLSEGEKARGVVCASAGNHAQGVAYACQFFGIRGTIFMPVTTPSQKVEKTRLTGGEFIEIVLTGDTFDQANVAAQEHHKKHEIPFIPPFDHPLIIEGQATVGAEIQEQTDQKFDFIVVPVGGGGLSAGLFRYYEEVADRPEIICAEPAGAASLKAGLEKGERVTLEKIDSFVDGAAVAQIGENNFEVLKEKVQRPIHLVPENRLCETMLEFLFHEGIVLEPAGGLSIDALKDFSRGELSGKSVVCVVSGGNFDFERLPDVKERAMKYSGLKKYLILRMPQRPGALKEFLSQLGPDEDIVRFEYLKKSARMFGSVLLGITTNNADNFPALFGRLDAAGFDYQDITEDQVVMDLIV